MTTRFTFVGNSQLITSIVKRYCTPSIIREVGDNWKQTSTFYSGNFTFKGVENQFLSCNMRYLGDPVYNYESETVSCNERLRFFVDEVGEDLSPIVVMLRGNEIAHCSIVDRPPRWDFSTVTLPAIKGRQFVHKRDIEDYFKKVISAILATCLLFRVKYPNRKIYYVFPPQIPADTVILRQPESFGALIERYGIIPQTVRMKIYEELFLLTKKFLDMYGVVLLVTPSICVDRNGCLKEEYTHGCLHGNENYGQVLMEHIWNIDHSRTKGDVDASI